LDAGLAKAVFMHKIGVIGSGYVGLVTGACLAELGNSVTCVDVDAARIEGLGHGRLPFFEPGLAELVERNRHAGRLAFSADVGAGVRGREIIFIAVGTPATAAGGLDVSAIRAAAMSIANALDGPKIVVNKSTVPVETAGLVSAIIEETKRGGFDVTVVSNPEFLREGSAISDFMDPDRIIIGSSDPRAEAVLRELYKPLDARIIVVDERTAELIKLAANAFLAMKLSYINEIANVCDEVGADIEAIVAGIGSDPRIGETYLRAGLGFGGSCIPKDARALHDLAASHGIDARMLAAAIDVNRAQIARVVDRLGGALQGLDGRAVAVLGLAFKPETDDVRESPAIALASALVAAGCSVSVHDPAAVERAREALGAAVAYAASWQDAVRDADAVIVATDWNEYKQLDFSVMRERMRGRVIVDARNIYDPAQLAAQGFTCIGIGRGHLAPGGAERHGEGKRKARQTAR
jgi:UDPglucose 6-dehydrogenase